MTRISPSITGYDAVEGRCIKSDDGWSYDREQAMTAERRAWAVSDGREHYFDGIHFWVTDAGVTFAARAEDAPERGWRHRDGCTCPLCRNAGQIGNATPPSGRRRPREADGDEHEVVLE